MSRTIGSIVRATLPLMRRNAESLMDDLCTIERESSGWDEDAQESVTTWTVVHADVPCHITEPSVSGMATITGESGTLETPLVGVPYTTTGVQPDDRVSVAGREPLWVTRAAYDDPTHPVEMLLACRWVR